MIFGTVYWPRWQCGLKQDGNVGWNDYKEGKSPFFKSRHFVLLTTCCTLLIRCYQFLASLSPISGVHWLQLATQVANKWDSSGTRTPSLCLEGCTVTCCILASYYQVFDFLWLCQALPVLLILEAGGSEFYVVSADGWIIFCSLVVGILGIWTNLAPICVFTLLHTVLLHHHLAVLLRHLLAMLLVDCVAHLPRLWMTFLHWNKEAN